MTDAERKLWRALRGGRFHGLSFRRQAPMGRYVADFVSHVRMLVIELDGGQHGEDAHAAADKERDAWIASRGYRVLRFWNNDVTENLDGVLEAIAETLRAGSSVRAGGGKD
jgi:very-short-patch-repair endonuclease